MTRYFYKAGLAPLLAAALCAAASHSVAAAPIYSALDLGTFGGPESLGPVFGGGLNVAGNTVGQADVSSDGSVYDAFLTAPNTAIKASDNLGTLPGFAVSVGYGLNNTGEAVGFVDTAGGDPTNDRAFVYDGTLHNLGTFGGSASDAFGINDSGTVVGGADDPNGNESAFVHSGTGPLVASDNIGTFGGNQSTAQAINNNGQVTGEAKTASGDFHAFLYSGTGVLVSSDDLGTLSGTGSSQGFALNAKGEVVGESSTGATSGTYHAFMDSNGTMTDLGTLAGDLNSQAFGINDLGFIVGESDNADPTVGFNGARAFLDMGNGLEDLNTLVNPVAGGYTLAQGLGINHSGQILVDGYTSAGQVHAFLLTPNAPPVPEPGSLQMFSLGAAGLGLCVLRRRRARA